MFNASVAPTTSPISNLTPEGAIQGQPDPETGDAFAMILSRSFEEFDLERAESPPEAIVLVAPVLINQTDLMQIQPEPANAEGSAPLSLALPPPFPQGSEQYTGMADTEVAKPTSELGRTSLESTIPAGTVASDPAAMAHSTTELQSQPDPSGTDPAPVATVPSDAGNGIAPSLVPGSAILPGTKYESALGASPASRTINSVGSPTELQPNASVAGPEAPSTRLAPVNATIDEQAASASRPEGALTAVPTGSPETTAGPAAFGAGHSTTPAAPPSPTTTPAGVASPASTPTLVATPAQLPDILSQSISSDEDRRDRIVVQLDPPELGRVSLEFKFDVQGLQTVTVSSETPEAMRRLRLMHFELVQALEQQGLSADNLNYSQQQSRQHAYQPPSRWSIEPSGFSASDIANLLSATRETRNVSQTIDGLDMRV